MRTFDEIYAAMRAAISRVDVAALHILADEMRALGIPEAEGEIELSYGNLHWTDSNFPAALEHYQRSQQAFEKVGSRDGVARATRNMGMACNRTANYTASLEYHQQSLQIFQELGDRAAVARGLNDIGNHYRVVGNYPAALEYYRRTLQAYEEIGDRKGVAYAMHGMGNVYRSTADYPAALEHYRNVLPTYEEMGDRVSIANVLSGIGSAYTIAGDYSAALLHYERAIQMYEEVGDRRGVAGAVSNIGETKFQTGDYAVALEHHRRAKQILEDLGDTVTALFVTTSVIAALIAVGEYEEAAELLQRQESNLIANPELQAEHFANRAALAEVRNELDAARDYLMKAINIVVESGNRGVEAEYHKRGRDLAQKANNFADYIKHNEEFNRITEEIRGYQATQRMAMMEADRKMEEERREREKERALLYGALPQSVADRMIRGERVTSDHYPLASVIFLDIVGFTRISDCIPPGQVVHLLEQIFSTLDGVCKTHGVTKIKTIGDCYMAVAFHGVHAAAQCALEMLATMNTLRITMPEDLGDTSWTSELDQLSVRIGMHCGPVTAGVIGTERLQYDVWGDTVNVASRMESTSEPGRIHVSEACAAQITADSPIPVRLTPRGEVDVKGKGLMTTYWLE